MKILISLIVIATAGTVGICNMKSLGKLPKGERLKRVETSKNYKDGKFVNKEHTPQFEHKTNSDSTDSLYNKKENRKPAKRNRRAAFHTRFRKEAEKIHCKAA